MYWARFGDPVPTTDAEAMMVQVAGIIYDAGLSVAEARKINDRSGWGFDVSLPSQRPYIGQSWTRCSDVHLSPARLEQALASASAMARGDYFFWLCLADARQRVSDGAH